MLQSPASVKKEENLGSNGYAFGMERKEGSLASSGLDFGSNGPGLGQKGLNLDSNVGDSDLVDEEDDDGWEFKGAEPKPAAAVENLKSYPNEPMLNFNMSTLSWDPLGTNAYGLSSSINGVSSNGSTLNSNLVDENDEFSDDDGWEFKAAEPQINVTSGNAKVEVQERENPKGSEFSFGFGNGVDGSSEFFGTSDGISKKPGEWDLGFGFPPSFESQSKLNGTENGEISSSVDKIIGSGEMSWAFKDATSGNGSEAKEEPKVADASSSGVEDFSFASHIQGNEETSKKPNEALPLSIFGDEEIEIEDPLRPEDVFILKPTITRAGMKGIPSNISINDLISSLYSQAEMSTSLNQISNPSENGLRSSQIEVGSNLVNGDNNLDDDSWEFHGAVSGTSGENQNSLLGFGDSYDKYSTKTELKKNPPKFHLLDLNGMALSLLYFLKSTLLSLTLLSSLLFFLFFLQSPRKPPLILQRSLISTSCDSQQSSESDSSLINYLYLHYCLFDEKFFLSIPFLSLLLLLDFYILIKTAQSHFSLVTTKLSRLLNLSPSMAAVTLLALGNGAPDVFASLHALRTGQYRTGFGAILSAGTFVSAFVVGFVAIYAAPFGVKPAPFIRDVLFYLTGALFLFYVYLSGEIFVWQAVGFVAFYVFFVGFVFWMDFGTEKEEKLVLEEELVTQDCHLMDKNCEIGDVEVGLKVEETALGIVGVWEMISKAWEVPVSFLLKLTIPQTSTSEWNRFYLSANIALCPLALLYTCNSFMPFDHPIVFLLPNTHFPLWFVVLFASFSFATLHFILEKEPPKNEQIPVVIVAFVMSVFWISTVAGELLNCLAALGLLLELPPALLGLTVLAWGNSVGDLVADVAVAKAGHPAMAMAGCFAGPMFNMLVGLGTALVMQTANVYPEAYQLNFHIGIIIAFVFLLSSLMGSLLVITWSRFRVPRFWGYCLVGLYIIFTLVSLIIARFSR